MHGHMNEKRMVTTIKVSAKEKVLNLRHIYNSCTIFYVCTS